MAKRKDFAVGGVSFGNATSITAMRTGFGGLFHAASAKKKKKKTFHVDFFLLGQGPGNDRLLINSLSHHLLTKLGPLPVGDAPLTLSHHQVQSDSESSSIATPSYGDTVPTSGERCPTGDK